MPNGPGMQGLLHVAIDGPAAVGKTVVGRRLAQQLLFKFLDTGAMYRAVTWAALNGGVHLDDDGALARLAWEVNIQAGERPWDDETFAPMPDTGQRVLVDGTDVSGSLRDPEVEQGVSIVAKVKDVREALVHKQRILSGGQCVVVGRDIGTVVLPHAQRKVFLEASVEVRARRRHQQLRDQGHSVDLDVVRADMEARDRLDSQRAHSPLRPADDAWRLVTDGLTAEQVVRLIYDNIKEHEWRSIVGGARHG